jgi:hypothetical protein
MKAKKRSPKRQAKQFPWQRLTPETPQWEREYVETLMIGLKTSPDIMTLYQGLAIWVLRVGQLERERNESTIVRPDGTPHRKDLLH